MSSSPVTFGDRTFVADDAALELWLTLLVDAIDSQQDKPDWLIAVRDEWDEIATEHLGVPIDLDSVAAPDRRTPILAACGAASRRLADWGESIPQATVNALRDWGAGYAFRDDCPTAPIQAIGRQFAGLLED